MHGRQLTCAHELLFVPWLILERVLLKVGSRLKRKGGHEEREANPAPGAHAGAWRSCLRCCHGQQHNKRPGGLNGPEKGQVDGEVRGSDEPLLTLLRVELFKAPVQTAACLSACGCWLRVRRTQRIRTRQCRLRAGHFGNCQARVQTATLAASSHQQRCTRRV